MKNLIIGLITLAMLSCAPVRVWQKTNDPTPTCKTEVDKAIFTCETTDEVAHAKNTLQTWRTLAWSLLLIPLVNIGMNVGLQAAANNYDTLLETCMRKQGYYCVEKRSTSKVYWDAASKGNISAEEQNKENAK
jgi:hypothetical protein